MSSWVKLVQTEDYEFSSYGRGLAYQLVHRPSKREVFVQGDDATELRRQLNAIQERYPNTAPWSLVLRELWSEYEQLATPLGIAAY
jgi:hypothetical protein